VVHFKTKHYNGARALLGFAFECLSREFDDEKPLILASFYEDPQNAALAMSLHYLMANVILNEGQHCSPTYGHISNDKIVEAAAQECSEAINLAEKCRQVYAGNGLLVAQAQSLLGYCLMSHGSRDMLYESSLHYQTATSLYNGYRGEANATRAPLAETDNTSKHSLFRPRADTKSDEVAACAA
jgi:hypothetical protein